MLGERAGDEPVDRVFDRFAPGGKCGFSGSDRGALKDDACDYTFCFETLGLHSVCLFAPPPYFEGFVRRHPKLTQRLIRLDERLGSSWPFNRAGDFYALVSQIKR